MTISVRMSDEEYDKLCTRVSTKLEELRNTVDDLYNAIYNDNDNSYNIDEKRDLCEELKVQMDTLLDVEEYHILLEKGESVPDSASTDDDKYDGPIPIWYSEGPQ